MTNYSLLSFRFRRLNGSVLVTNFVGDYLWLTDTDFTDLISGRIRPETDLFHDLQANFLITTGDINFAVDMLATRYRTKKAFLEEFTTLHMVVTTLRCNQSCSYCQASAKDENASDTDMTESTATRVAEMIMRAPSKSIKVEFQGGEPSLNFKAIETVTERVLELNRTAGKQVEFVICTNLFRTPDHVLDYCRHRNFCISTSLDGPAEIHDRHRKGGVTGVTHARVVEGIEKAASYVGRERIGALMTATRNSLGRFPEIIDEYLRLGLRHIVFRPLNPYGRSVANQSELSYSVQEYMSSVEEGLRHIVELNRSGINMVEGYTSLLLRRMLTPFPTGYVDLQSPSGSGISGAIYNHTGGIYASDEGRMLAEMGDERFRLGDVRDDYKSVFAGEKLKEIVRHSIVETLPQCSDCAYRMWCGADPVRQYAVQKDLVGHKAFCDFCHKHTAHFDLLLRMLDEGDSTRNILWNWAWGPYRPRGETADGHV